MATVYMYILGASPNPDQVECGVPWGIGKDEVFFGPCKKNLRAALRRLLLKPDTDHVTVKEEIYFAGFNALAGGKVRKIVWTGRMREAMSFGRAYVKLTDAKFDKMRRDKMSPLHAKPIAGPEGRPLGYELVSEEHAEKAAWLRDLASESGVRRLQANGYVARLPPGVSWWEGFERDVCFLFGDCFLARGEGQTGLAIDEELVAILKDAQKERRGVDSVAVFGLNADDTPNGRTGSFLKLTDALADRFLKWLAARRGQPADISMPAGEDRAPAPSPPPRKPRGSC